MKRQLLNVLNKHAQITVIFVCSLLFHSFVIFVIFPHEYFPKYEPAAKSYLEGTLRQERLVDFSPLYLHVHIFIKKYVYHVESSVIICWIHIVFTAFSAVFLFKLLRSFFHISLAGIGTFLFMTNSSIILYTGTIEPEPLMIFFILGFLFYISQPHHLGKILAGIFLGLSLLTRSNFFLLVLITPVHLWWQESSKRAKFRSVILFEIPLLLTLGFLVMRNSTVAGSFTVFSMNPGYVFYEGNNPNSKGDSAIYPLIVHELIPDLPSEPDLPHEIYRIVARRINHNPLSIAEINAYWSHKAINFILDHPDYFFKQLLQKTHSFFHNFRKHDISYVHWKDLILQETIPTTPFAVIVVLGLIGMILAAKVWKRWMLFYAVFFIQFSIMLLTYVSDRQRVSIIAIVIVFAMGALNSFIERKKLSKLLFVFGLLLLPGLYINNEIANERNDMWKRLAKSKSLRTQAFRERNNGNFARASELNVLSAAVSPIFLENKRLAKLHFRRNDFKGEVLNAALRLREENDASFFDLAILLIKNENFIEAEKILHDLKKRHYRSAHHFLEPDLPSFYLAVIAEQRNEPNTAVLYLKDALTRNPGDPWVLSHLFCLTDNPIYKSRIFRYFNNIDAEIFLGQAYLQTGRFQDAINSFRIVITNIPEYRKGAIYLSLALGAMGDYVQAVEYYMGAFKKSPEPIWDDQQVLDVFYKWLERNPQTVYSTYRVGTVLEEFGHYEQAINVLEDILEHHAALLSRAWKVRISTKIKHLEAIQAQYSTQ